MVQVSTLNDPHLFFAKLRRVCTFASNVLPTVQNQRFADLQHQTCKHDLNNLHNLQAKVASLQTMCLRFGTGVSLGKFRTLRHMYV